MLPTRRLSGRRIWTLEAALVISALLAITMAPVPVVADQVVPVGDERAVAKSVVVILPFTVCPTCQLPSVLAEVQADPADAARVHAALGKRLDAGVYATVTNGRATMTQLTRKPSRLDILELYSSSGLLAQAVRAADGSYEIAVRHRREPQRLRHRRPGEPRSRQIRQTARNRLLWRRDRSAAFRKVPPTISRAYSS